MGHGLPAYVVAFIRVKYPVGLGRHEDCPGRGWYVPAGHTDGARAPAKVKVPAGVTL